MSGTSGDFSRLFVNGIEATSDIQGSQYTHAFEAVNAPHENVGVHTSSPGVFNPSYSNSNAYRAHQANGRNLHALLSKIDVGSSDIELIISEVRGFKASPQVGDLGVMFQGHLERYNPTIAFAGLMTADVSYKPGGKRSPLFPRCIHLQNTGKNSFNSTPVDMGASAVGVALGAVGHLHVFTPTGVAASGNVTVPSAPSDGDTAVIGGVTFTFKTSLTPTAGQVLIAGNPAANLFAAATGGDGAGTTYAAGTTPAPSTVYLTPPTAAGLIAVTYKTTGTAGNSFTLAKTGSVVTVSGATLASGAAGDTFTFKLQSATSSGGSYTDRMTFSADGTLAVGERQEVAIGTAMDRWWRLNATASAANHDLGVLAMMGLFYNL